MQIVVVTGLSGAGKSTSIRALEDLGYTCVDNLPVPMLLRLVELLGERGVERLAVGMDARAEHDFEEFSQEHAALTGSGHSVEVLFLEAPVPALVRRFSETRRRHPLGELPRAIDDEVTKLAPLRDLAKTTINTERMTARDLRRHIRDRFGAVGRVLQLVLMSFGFKNGLPSEADLVFDARFLENPYDHPELRPQSGFDAAVRDFVLSQKDAISLLDQLEALIRFQAPRALREGRSYLTVAVGCTGGQHRSVALTENLAARLGRPPALGSVSTRHRDVQRNSSPAGGST